MNNAPKYRSPWSVWWLSLVTFGIYYLVWYVKINKEIAAHSNGAVTVRTGGLWFSQCVIIANWISLANTSGRLAQVQTMYGLPVTTTGGMTVLSSFWFWSNTRYTQRRWNATFEAIEALPVVVQSEVAAPGALPVAAPVDAIEDVK